MIHSPTSPRLKCGPRLQRLRQHAGLTRAALAEISGIGSDFIEAVENDTLCHLVSDQTIRHVLARSADGGAQQIMQATLVCWAEGLHRLADALADTFENLFPVDYLAALSDQLWLKIQYVQRAQAALDHQPPPLLPDNPWHAWGWFRNVALPDDLPDDAAEEQFEACDLKPVIRDLLAGLEPHEQIVITLRYGLDGPNCTRAETARQLGLTRAHVFSIEQRAMRYLQHPRRSCRLRGCLN